MSQLWTSFLMDLLKRKRGVDRDMAPSSHLTDSDLAAKMIEAQDSIISRRSGKATPTVLDTPEPTSTHGAEAFKNDEDYFRQRAELERRERALAFDHACAQNATPEETRANEILQRLKRRDRRRVYAAAPPRTGFGGQVHPRREGDHYLSNAPLIARTDVFRLARRMPKGAHLHIHFNSCLPPAVLLGVAAGMERMFITSDIPLTPEDDFAAFWRCEIQFSMLPPEREVPGDVFSAGYMPRQTMRYQEFLAKFANSGYPRAAEEWLTQKLTFGEDEAYDKLQTSYGAWAKFNARTRMMKGLFNYEKAYRTYTRLCLEDFVADNIQYAEIRPNFMKTNQLFTDDASAMIDNKGIMEIIIEEYERFQRETDRYFAGLRVIYCTPRSFSKKDVEFALDECLEFKQKWPKWIAGFDLVGEEAQGHPLKHFVPQLLSFRRKCASLNLDIPFLLHCGETLEVGTPTDSNLFDALLLNARRIGHGFALPRHPYVLEQMKARGVCVELCPISNEVLGLTPRVGGHAMYELLARGVNCTVSSDNGALFGSSLSCDFYQVMVGSEGMGIWGWRQLAEWSLEHACMEEGERAAARGKWEVLWREFVGWIVETYGDVEDEDEE